MNKTIQKSKIIHIAIFVMMVSVMLFFSNIMHSQEYEYQYLINRIAAERYAFGEDKSGNFEKISTLDGWAANQNDDGTWNDVNFDNHLWRLWYLAGASANSSHSKYNDIAYKNAVKKGLEYWYSVKPSESNWWFNKIAYPQRLGEILIFMREFPGFIPVSSTTEIDETKILSLFIPTSIEGIISHGTGANALDIGLHYVFRGILTEDDELLENTQDCLQSILANNIKADIVMHDHGPQIQIGSYGSVLAGAYTRLAYYLVDSPAAFNPDNENVKTAVRFIRETQISSIRGRMMDFSVLGRSVSRINGTIPGMDYLQKMADGIDPENAQYYIDAMDRSNGNTSPDYNIREFNKHYWASDYTQHARGEYLFAVRNVSTRTVETETGNGENLKANYFSYGATFISANGTEYINIMPVWDWSMIPGTTFPHTNYFPARSNWGVNYGNTSFVGGVSNNTYGSSVLDLDEAGIKGKKSWFFFEDEIVCLGAGITDNSGNNVRTTVNQCWKESSSYYKEVGDVNETMKGDSTSTYENSNLEYIRHGEFGYYFPDQGNVKFSLLTQTGKWSEINAYQSSNAKFGDVFTLWFDHGSNPDNEKYSYIVVPGIDSEEKATAYDMSEIEIVENTKSLQAVYHKTLDLLQVIFHYAGTINHNGRSISVDQPCALMFENGTLVTISDPAQTRWAIEVTINVNHSEYAEFIYLPGQELTGSSVSVDFELPANIQKETVNSGMTVTPNPTEGILHITSENQKLMNVEVININGQRIMRDSFNGRTTLDITGYPNGIYFIKATDGNGQTYQEKILKY